MASVSKLMVSPLAICLELDIIVFQIRRVNINGRAQDRYKPPSFFLKWENSMAKVPRPCVMLLNAVE